MTSRRAHLLAALALLLLIAAGRLAIIAHFSTDLPYMDQWAAETNAFVIPFGEGTFGPAKLFLPTNEHRIAFTLATNAALVAVSGQWDARQQMVVNALLYSALFAGVWFSLVRGQGRWWPALMFLVVAAVGGLPIVAENIVWGFQSQFFFVSGFSLYCLYLLLGAPPGSWRWHTGWIAGACAMLSLGSGFLAPLVVLVVAVAQTLLGGTGFRHRRPAIAAAVLLLAFAWLVHPVPPPQSEALHAANPRQFFTYLFAGMAWPATDLFWLGPLVYLPGFCLTWLWCQRPAWRDAFPTYVLAAILWVGLQTAAIAWTRSNTTMWPPANRYGDLYLYGFLFNIAAAICLIERLASVRARRSAVTLLFAVLAAGGVGAAQGVDLALHTRLTEWRAEFRVYEKTLAAYLVDHDANILTPGTFPYPSRDIMVYMLSQPGIRSRLPASVLPDDPGRSDRPSANDRTGGKASRLSRTALSLCEAWPLFAGLGAILAALAAVFCVRPVPRAGEPADIR